MEELELLAVTYEVVFASRCDVGARQLISPLSPSQHAALGHAPSARRKSNGERVTPYSAPRYREYAYQFHDSLEEPAFGKGIDHAGAG